MYHNGIIDIAAGEFFPSVSLLHSGFSFFLGSGSPIHQLYPAARILLLTEIERTFVSFSLPCRVFVAFSPLPSSRSYSFLFLVSLLYYNS